MAYHLVPLPPVEQVERQLRSIAMLTPGQPALNREDAYILLAQLIVALSEIKRLRGSEAPAWRRTAALYVGYRPVPGSADPYSCGGE